MLPFDEFLKLVNTGGIGGLALYLVWRDIYAPKRKNGNGNGNGHANGSSQTKYATESDVNGLAISFREHRATVTDHMQDMRDRMVRVETILETDGHNHGGKRG